MAVEGMEFETSRLNVGGWHKVGLPASRELTDIVAQLLTPATTRALPPDWQGEYDKARASTWIKDRDAESSVFLVSEKSSEPIGLVILFSEGRDVRLGYLLAESTWGKGFGSELVEGICKWCRDSDIRSLTGGVALDNPASARVLVKNGFVAVGGPEHGEQMYELRF
mmetsp:Transcript_20619/g.49067  ORF Transcript_20619/g.49067 Transcript_20619/m.49067 type:complete len:167 (+) Transcript_20619:1-501(+)|eukprot:CAMPEP_0175915596 /NCGR_PEP_ID=MMETSP0108-20121206/10400_1 /TAXON_ID=195067 ORGANISM="Goniomonas pacifica, Strain CCMP1869" /NCGR_SAMPLE_ID=MMETSP0108 /ASSEMBLY_ACC=CAM_ASM_000204 /LENGTH=166 /DNA_ID=CAMNT_0017238097 /DNA_START=1 /DNA_END=501 /DNA_ORIENTATION=+